MAKKTHYINIQVFDSALWVVIDGSGVMVDRDAVHPLSEKLCELLSSSELVQIRLMIDRLIEAKMCSVSGPRYNTLEEDSLAEKERKLEAAYDAERRHRPIVGK